MIKPSEKINVNPGFFYTLYEQCVSTRDKGQTNMVVCELENDDYGSLYDGGEELLISELKSDAREVYNWLESNGFNPYICSYLDRPNVWLLIARFGA